MSRGVIAAGMAMAIPVFEGWIIPLFNLSFGHPKLWRGLSRSLFEASGGDERHWCRGVGRVASHWGAPSRTAQQECIDIPECDWLEYFSKAEKLRESFLSDVQLENFSQFQLQHTSCYLEPPYILPMLLRWTLTGASWESYHKNGNGSLQRRYWNGLRINLRGSGILTFSWGGEGGGGKGYADTGCLRAIPVWNSCLWLCRTPVEWANRSRRTAGVIVVE